MATSIVPMIVGPDGVATTALVFTTTSGARFFTGTCAASTVTIEVSIRGGGYTDDPDYVVFDGTGWTVPNPEVFPDGLTLVSGENTLAIRAVTTSGSVSSPATALVRYVQGSDLGVAVAPPTNVTLEMLDSSVKVTVDGGDADAGFVGINIYASTAEGGGATGYTRINLTTVSAPTTVEELIDIGEFDSEALVILDAEGLPAADPLYVSFTGTQVDSEGVVLQTDFEDSEVLVPEGTDRVRTTVTVQGVRVVSQYSFIHVRTAGPSSTPPTVANNVFAGTRSTDPLYYVVTAVFYDDVNLLEIESPYSVEVVGHPLTVGTVVANFPTVSRQQVVRDTITAIFRSNPQVKVEPGSFLRDTFIDPFSSEAERLRFIVDFLHRAQSFSGLLQVDDPNRTGSSVAVSASAYKTALKVAFGLSQDTDVQGMVDRAFESLASNVGVYRRPGQSARGEITCFTPKRPTSTLVVPVGATVGSPTFRVTQGKSIPLANLARFYDPTSGRYSVTVAVQAVTAGSAGNVAKGQVKRVISGITGLSVINTGDMFGGKDQETNQELATRAQNALASVDAGTRRGYLKTAADVPGVEAIRVVSAGDALMNRDLDALGVHRGGKVDVWVRGTSTTEVTDTLAFGFNIASDVHFILVGAASDLIFRAVDSLLSTSTPILELLSDTSVGYAFRNATTGLSFDLTNYTILSYDTVQLSTEGTQPDVTLTDVVLGDYRRRTEPRFVLPRQPVSSLTSVVGTDAGTLTTGMYSLYHPAPPTVDGRSTLAGDYLLITPVAGVPGGGSTTVQNESHVLTGEYVEHLDSLGVNPLSIVLKNADGTVTYAGPHDPAGNPDYAVNMGSQTEPTGIVRVAAGTIVSGSTVLVTYTHEENFTVTYAVNNMVTTVQNSLDAMKHVTADVLAKAAIPCTVDLSMTLVLVRGAARSTVDSQVRTNLTNYMRGLGLGQPLRQSDVVGVVEGTRGVSYVEVPLTKMTRGDGSIIAQEEISTDVPGDVLYTSWSSPSVSVWLLSQALVAGTVTGGTSGEDFAGVFQDDVHLTAVTSSLRSVLRAAAGRATIVGGEGVSIEGYSDDATLVLEGYATEALRIARRAAITGNRVLVSTSVDDPPTTHAYTVTYVAEGDTGVKNIDPGDAEYLVPGTWDFTFTEDAG